MTADIYSFRVKTLAGDDLDFSQFKGQGILVVNTASRCGFTPQLEGLEKLYREFKHQGFVVVGFPCNQFGGQDPGDAVEIGEFCLNNYGVSFPLAEKIAVNGPQAHPLFNYLTAALPGVLGTRSVKWNFTKFLIDQDGKPVRRFGPLTTPRKIAPVIARLLG